MFDFEIGQQVVCVYEGPWSDYETFEPSKYQTPNFGTVYTIRGVEPIAADFLPLTIPLVLRLYEICPERLYAAECFRPVRKTSIEQFRHHLVKKSEPVL